MEYHGKLYGKFNGKPFDTGKTSDDFDNLEKENKEMKAMLQTILPMFTELDSQFGKDNPPGRIWSVNEIKSIQNISYLLKKVK